MARMPAIEVDIVPTVHPPAAVQMVLTSGEVATMLGYLRRDGKPNRFKIYELARAGTIPAAIRHESLSTIDWRWSRPLIEQYCRGEWEPATGTRTKRQAS